MSLSVGMNSGLLALLNINSQMSTVQSQLQSGKRFNSAADGAVQWLQISDFSNRASTLTQVNDGLTVGLSQLTSASNALTSVRTKLVDAQNALNDAYTTQQAVVGTPATTDTPSADAESFQLNFALDPKGSATSFNGQTVLDGNMLINNSRVHSGDSFTIQVGTQAINIKIAPDSQTVYATSAQALSDINAKITADTATQNTANANATTATNTLAGAMAQLNAGVGNAGAFNVAGINAAGALVVTPGLGNINIAFVNAIAGAKGIANTQVSAQNYIDSLHSISTGALTVNGVTAAQATAVLTAMRAVAQNPNNNNGLMSIYANAVNGMDQANLALNNANTTLATDQGTQTYIQSNEQGVNGNAYLVAMVDDYMNVLSSFKDANGNKAISFNQAAPDQYSPLTTFSAVGTASQALTLTRTASGNPNDVADIRNLFKSIYDPVSSSTDTTKAYDESSWSQNGNSYTLKNTHHTGSTPGQVTTPPDAKRKIAANTFRQLLKDVDALVNDSGVGGLNLLKGGTLSVAINAEGSKFNFQLTNDDGSAATLDSAGLGLDVNAANVNNTAGGTNNNFANNADMDVALTQLSAAISKLDLNSGYIGDAQSSLQDRSSFNKSMIDLFNTTATNLNAVDTNAASAQLAALQTQQSFATSIMSIIKQGEQNPLQLLR